jgi:hypothetical protein
MVLHPKKVPLYLKQILMLVKDIISGDYIDDQTEEHDNLALHVEEKIALMRMYNDEGLHNGPSACYVIFQRSVQRFK